LPPGGNAPHPHLRPDGPGAARTASAHEQEQKRQAIGFLLKMLTTKAPDLDAWERDRGYPLLNNPVLAPDSAEWRVTAERRQLNLLPAAASAAPNLELIA